MHKPSLFPPPETEKPRTMARLEFVWSTIEAMATISDLLKMYAI